MSKILSGVAGTRRRALISGPILILLAALVVFSTVGTVRNALAATTFGNDFFTATISQSPETRTVLPGEDAVFTITVTDTAYNKDITLSFSGGPPGAVATFVPPEAINPLTSTFESTLTVSVPVGTPAGTYDIFEEACIQRFMSMFGSRFPVPGEPPACGTTTSTIRVVVPGAVDLGPIEAKLDSVEGKLDSLDFTVDLSPIEAKLDSVEGKVDSLDFTVDLSPIEAKLDAGLDETVSSRATQTSVDALETKLDALWFNVDGLLPALNTELPPMLEDLLFTANLPIEAKLDSVEGKLDSLDVAVDLSPIETKLDAGLDETVSSRATQTSVDALEAKLDTLESAVSALEAKLDQLTELILSLPTAHANAGGKDKKDGKDEKD
jgi:polyhydroxyalkanoate synthesis regulator phasin